jgi:hypothetical protein
VGRDGRHGPGVYGLVRAPRGLRQSLAEDIE